MNRAWITMISGALGVILAAGGFTALMGNADKERETSLWRSAFNFFSSDGGDRPEHESEEALALAAGELPGNTGSGFGDPVFSHPTRKFSFSYPASLGATSHTEGEGREVVVFDSKEGKAKEGFQFTLTSIDDNSPISVERIREDVPELEVRNPVTGVLGDIPIVAFESSDPSIGNTFEIWFVHDWDLYQFTAYVEYKDRLIEVLNTWRIEK